jgi:hypothetical protein
MSTTTKSSDVAEALRETLISPNVADSNWEASNVVDALDSIGSRIASALRELAAAIRAANANEGGRGEHRDHPSD